MLKALFRKLGKSKKGFTLIELLVVIAILGILAAILIPVVGGYISSSRQSVANADARTVFSAASTVVAQNPDITFTTYSNTTLSGTRVTGTMYLSDLSPYLGTVNFTISAIHFDTTTGNVTGVDVTGDHGASGTYTKS